MGPVQEKQEPDRRYCSGRAVPGVLFILSGSRAGLIPRRLGRFSGPNRPRYISTSAVPPPSPPPPQQPPPFSPSAVTYRCLIKGLIGAGRISEAVDLFWEMLNKEHGADSLVHNNLIKRFLNLGNLDMANELFDEIKKRCCVYGGSVDATFIDWFFKQGREKEAMESYKSLLDQPSKMTLDTCNALLELLLKHNRKTEAWALFHQMWKIRSPYVSAVTSDTFNIMVNGFFRLGNISEAFDVFKLNGLNRLATYNNIITRCCEHGMLEDAEKLFAEVGAKWVSPDVYRALIDAYFKQERIEDAVQTFNKMVDVSLSELAGEPATSLFGELIKYGKVAETVPILTKMGRRNPKPDPTIYEVMVMGLCNNVLLDEARDIVGQQMRYGVGVTPALRDCVLDTFGRAGRNEEIERLLEIERHGFGTPWNPPDFCFWEESDFWEEIFGHYSKADSNYWDYGSDHADSCSCNKFEMIHDKGAQP